MGVKEVEGVNEWKESVIKGKIGISAGKLSWFLSLFLENTENHFSSWIYWEKLKKLKKPKKKPSTDLWKTKLSIILEYYGEILKKYSFSNENLDCPILCPSIKEFILYIFNKVTILHFKECKDTPTILRIKLEAMTLWNRIFCLI